MLPSQVPAGGQYTLSSDAAELVVTAGEKFGWSPAVAS